jgi:hypothetical protein
MAFDCKCGHTRGKHDNPQKDSGSVGKCNAYVAEGVRCACRHWSAKSNKFSDLKDYQKLGMSYMIIAFIFSGGLILWIANIEETLGSYSPHIGAFVAGLLILVIWWVKFGESWIKREQAERLE